MFTRFEQARTVEDVQRHLQELIRELLTYIAPERLQSASQSVFDLKTLADFSYADLQHHPRPVWVLSEICRLLFKVGDSSALRQALAVTHILYAFKCSHNESWRVAALYRGIAQIGLQILDLGIKNVVSGLQSQRDFELTPIDHVLGLWALTSAAIANRNLRLAATFARQWQETAAARAFPQECFRAEFARHLFDLLSGEIVIPPEHLEAFAQDAPLEWGGAVMFLLEWAQRVEAGQRVEHRDICEPCPLFLGVEWRPAAYNAPHTAKGLSNDFSLLCDIRRTFCHPNAIDELTPDMIERYADCLARWELPRPLYDFETILKHKAAVKNFHYVMSRLLGKQVMETVTNKRPIDPDVVTQDEAIILVMDVRKFSTLSEGCSPEEIFDLLNPIFKIMHEELEQAGGTILEFVGDCIIVVFNMFREQDARILEILRATIRAMFRIHAHNALSVQAGLPEIRVGVGINQGPVALGYLGGLARCHLTVLGNTINLAARIESSSKELPGDVIVSDRCFGGTLPDIWTTPDGINFSVRDVGCHAMRNIAQPVHLFALNPLLRSWIDFVPMGFVAAPERAVVYLDTGNARQPGIIDHHFGGHDIHSACELLVRQPELLLDHLRGIPFSQLEFRLHTQPDLDCAATLYAAYELLGKRPRHDLLRALAAYVSLIDQGRIPNADRLSDSMIGMFIAHQRRVADTSGQRSTDWHLLEAGLRVIDAALYLLEEAPTKDLAHVFESRPQWFPEERRLIQDDRRQYQEDVALRSHAYAARINGVPEPVTGLWLDHPQSIFYKLWAKAELTERGEQRYYFMTLDLSSPEKNRFIIRVDPDCGTDLNGLGLLLEEHETRKRQQLGKNRPIEPIRYPADNSDPWYFGQGHQYTILDAPWEGTVLTAAEVQRIHEEWQGGKTHQHGSN